MKLYAKGEILNSVNQNFQASFEICQKNAETGTGTVATLILPKMYD
ncbi:hypothetical protein ACFOWA_17565 [Pedobacter lithocola]|uniref:Uncharacterized protein n=1 Tax=Pedobacter lithocola TaxID=1908239 RepID=A0ABV8PCV7_9SPHI